MIVISGALVLVALVLLVVGLTMTDLQFVYASIAVSLLAFVFLVIGILQRRGEQPAPAAAPDAVPAGGGDAARPQGGSAPMAAVPVDVSKRPEPAADVDPPVEDDDVEDELLEGGLVLVVAGRPRYHVDGCRYLNGKDVEEIDVFDARDEGFTPCGVCKPDEVLAAELEDGDVELVTEEVEEPLDDEPAVAEDDDELDELDDDELDDSDVEDEPAPARGSTRLDPAATQTLAVPAAPVKKAAAKKAPAKKAAAKKAPAKAPAKAAAETPAALPLSAPPARSTAARSVPAAAKAGPRSAAKAAPAAPAKAAAAASTPAASTAAKKGTVVVIPDRGKFHVATCRYVRDAADALELSKASATKQGYAACGVCKP